MTAYVEELIQSRNLEVISEIATDSRIERRRRLPEAVLTGDKSSLLPKLLGRDDFSVWEHQAQAIDHLVNRRNVVVST